ncbi:hypothetical protein ABPG72_002475 [Tetrahymena utriculariae]
MIYFYIGFASLAVFIMNIIQFRWLLISQNNQFHQLINLWLDDPIEKVQLVELIQICPDGTQEEKITYKFRGTSGLCSCDIETSQVQHNIQTNITFSECSDLKCSNSTKVQKVNAIPTKSLFYLFQSPDKKITYKLCASRIQGYSFAKKAPTDQKCGSDEQYCSWNNTKNGEFDIDYGYCIPQNRECFSSAVQLSQVNNNQPQLPLVKFFLDDSNSKYYNIEDYHQVFTSQLLEINKINFPSEYNSFLQQSHFLHTAFIPRVKNRCRQKLKDTLNIYIGPEIALQIQTALIFFSFISMVSSFFITGFKDFEDFKDCNWQTKLIFYLQKKKYNRKHPLHRKLYYIQKLIVLIIQIALYASILSFYVSMINVFGEMVSSSCIDSQISQVINYQNLNGDVFNYNITIACLFLTFFCLLTDINLYVFLKKLLRAVIRVMRTLFLVIYILFTSRDFSQLKKQEQLPDPDVVDQYQIKGNSKKDVENQKKEKNQPSCSNKNPSFQDMSVINNLKVNESKQNNKMTDEQENAKSVQKLTSRSDNTFAVQIINQSNQSNILAVVNKLAIQQVDDKEEMNSNIRCLESSKISEHIPSNTKNHQQKLAKIFQQKRTKLKQKSSKFIENCSKECDQTSDMTKQIISDDYSLQKKDSEVISNNFELRSPSSTTTSKKCNESEPVQLDFQIEIQNL